MHLLILAFPLQTLHGICTKAVGVCSVSPASVCHSQFAGGAGGPVPRPARSSVATPLPLLSSGCNALHLVSFVY